MNLFWTLLTFVYCLIEFIIIVNKTPILQHKSNDVRIFKYYQNNKKLLTLNT